MLFSSATLMGAVFASILVSIFSVNAALQTKGNKRETVAALQHVERQQSELELFAEGQQQLADAQELMEFGIDSSTDTVRAVHHSIAAIPFEILEAIPVTRDTSKVVRSAHDLISNAVYSGIGLSNKAVGKMARKGLKTDSKSGNEKT